MCLKHEDADLMDELGAPSNAMHVVSHFLTFKMFPHFRCTMAVTSRHDA